MNLPSSFKRLAVGQIFTTAQGSFRKASKRGAFALIPATDPVRPNRGRTHAQIPFARSTTVTV